MPAAARILVGAGLLLVVAGVLYWVAPSLFSWFGKLPGDIRHETDQSRVYVPITSMIVVSIVLTAIVNLVRFFFR